MPLRIAFLLVILTATRTVTCRPQVTFDGVPRSIAVGAKILVGFEIVYTDTTDLPLSGVNDNTPPELGIVPDTRAGTQQRRTEFDELKTSKRDTRFRKTVHNSFNVPSNPGVYYVQATVEGPDGSPESFFSEPFTASALGDQNPTPTPTPTSTTSQTPTPSSASPASTASNSETTASRSTSTSTSVSATESLTSTGAAGSTGTPATFSSRPMDMSTSTDSATLSSITSASQSKTTHITSLSYTDSPSSTSKTAQESLTPTGSPNPNPDPNQNRKNRIGIIVGSVIGGVLFVMLVLSLVICRYRHSRAMLERDRLLTRARPYRLLLGDVRVKDLGNRREGKMSNLEGAGHVDVEQPGEIISLQSLHGQVDSGPESRLPSQTLDVLEDLPPEYRTAC